MMKRAIICILVIAGITTISSAQSFNKKNHALNIELGYPQAYFNLSSYYDDLPVLSFSYEYGLEEIKMGESMDGVISVGGYLSATGGKQTYFTNNYFNWKAFTIAARVNYHFVFHKHFDTYAGLLIGMSLYTYTWKGSGADPGWRTKGDLEIGPYAGFRWFFSKTFAVNAELGYLPAWFNAGVTFKFD